MNNVVQILNYAQNIHTKTQIKAKQYWTVDTQTLKLFERCIKCILLCIYEYTSTGTHLLWITCTYRIQQRLWQINRIGAATETNITVWGKFTNEPKKRKKNRQIYKQFAKHKAHRSAIQYSMSSVQFHSIPLSLSLLHRLLSLHIYKYKMLMANFSNW